MSVRFMSLLDSGSKEPQNESVEVPEDEEDHAEPKAAGLRFQSIDETGHGRARGEALRLIRSQARRDVSRQKQNLKQNLSSKQVPRPLLPRSKSDKSKQPSNSAVPGILVAPASHKVDPFNTLPVGEGGKAQFLISKLTDAWYPTEHPYSPIKPTFGQDECTKAVLSDATLLHMSLSHSAVGYCSLASMEFAPVANYNLGQTISIINKRIADFDHIPITHKDKTISTVGFLAHFEIRYGSQASAKIYCDGMKALIKSRGGMQAFLATDLFSSRMTFWFDIINAFIMGSKPWYQDELDNPALYPGLKDLKPSTKEIGAQYQIKLSNLTGLQDLSQETIKVYGLLHRLMTKMERVAALWSNGVTDAEHQSFQLHSFRIMYRLIALVQYEFPSSSRNSLIYGLFGNAGMAHLFMFTFNVLPRIGDAILISKRIRTSLEIINMQRFQIAYPEMIIWVVMIGGMASIGARDEDTK